MDIIKQLQNRYRNKKILSVLILLLGISVSTYFIATAFESTFETGLTAAVFIFIAGIVVFAFTGGFSRPNKEVIFRYLDRNHPEVEDSSFLLDEAHSNPFEQWQKSKIEEQLSRDNTLIALPNGHLKKAGVSAIMLLLISAGFNYYYTPSEEMSFSQSETSTELNEQVLTNPIPALEEIQIDIEPPTYTNLPKRTEDSGNISVTENSTVRWKITSSGLVEDAVLLFNDGDVIDMELNNSSSTASTQLSNNQIYQVALSNADTTIHSDYFSIKVNRDEEPKFSFHQPTEQRSFITHENPEFEVDVEISDDFKVNEIELHATLARGSGENVRFREHTLPFDERQGIGSSFVKANAKFEAEELEMEPGDELYFFVTATDNKPQPQTAKSDTYFIIYQDTTETEQPTLATVAVDILPEYFRSQRQIIIDTEQLLDEKSAISKEEFEIRSNAIGQDQNLLRLRYGQYLGLEDESGSDATVESEESHEEGEHEHAEEDHQEETSADNVEDLTAMFGHDHGSPEMNTLFADSPKAMLKEALDNMWNAELYLRTFRPEEALPYEYRALELLKAVQQADRQYTRKSGYTSIPIPVEEKRLTGTYDDFAFPEAASSPEFNENPLARIEHIIRSNRIEEVELNEVSKWLQESDIAEADQLYLLNRLRRATESGLSDELKEELLSRLSELNSQINYDPAPSSLPQLGNLQRN